MALFRRQHDPQQVLLSRIATVLLVLVFAFWLAWFGVTAPWDVTGHVRTATDFLGRFFGILVLLAVIFSPLAIAAIGARPRR